jgi:hypothetical protein
MVKNKAKSKMPTRPMRGRQNYLPPSPVTKLTSKRAATSSSDKLAAAVVQQLMDPCDSPAVPLPDRTHGRSQIITTTTTSNLLTDATGDRHLVVFPAAKNKIGFSGTGTFGTYTYQDDPQLAAFATDYKYVRMLGYCVTLNKASAGDTPDGDLLFACCPESTSFATAAGALTFVEENGAQMYNAAGNFEAGWCPRSEHDFAPFDSALGVDSSVNLDENGRLLNWRPSLNFLIQGAIGTAYRVTVVCRYEAFMISAKQYQGVANHLQDSAAMDKVMSVIPSINWVAVGNAVARTSSYAAKVAGLVGGSSVESLVSGVGKLAGGLIASVARL